MPEFRRRALIVAVLLACGGLAACAASDSSAPEAAGPADSSPAGDVFPVVVEHRYGDQPFATWPWAQELLGDAEPEVPSAADGFELERIAALEPDLIVGTNSGMSRKDYELLSAIAPTITSVEGSTLYFSSWQDQTMQIAKALGQEADGQLYVYPDGLGTEFLTDLGFTMTDGLEEFALEDGTQALISAENVGLIDADVVVFATESADMFDGLQSFGTIGTLPAVAEDRAVYTDEVLAGAIYFLTPLSLEYVLDELTPMLEKAAAGQALRAYPS